MSTLVTEIQEKLEGQTEAVRTETMVQLVQNAPASIKKEIMERGVGRPGSKARDCIWIITISSLSLVLILGGIALAAGMFSTTTGVTKPDTMLTIVTTIAGFLAGFFAPSPLDRE